MPDFIVWISQYTEYFPVAAFFLLLLAGLYLPVSEDLIIITGALLCRGDPPLLVPVWIATYIGVLVSDYIPYFLGKFIRKGAIKSSFVTKLFSEKKLDRMHHYLEKYGIFTFIVGRFIPFGVRNTLFLTSGFFGLGLRRFALYDITAATISVNTLFFLSYYFGESVEKPFHAVGLILLIILFFMVVFIIFRLISSLISRLKESCNKQSRQD
jgi:membrane protein DedA with SNARE-associated domain